MYPENDDEFIDLIIKSVEKETTGWAVTRTDGWSNFIQGDSSVEPKPGMAMRQYGRGTAFRGIFLEGQKVFYRTAAEDGEYQDIQLYGADAADWLKRWDEGRGVWSIEMGGLGPGYEQAIQVTAAEILRHLLEAKYDSAAWSNKDKWATDREKIEENGFANPKIKAMGLSGAQWGAAISLATALYAQGPRQIMNDPKIKDRKIQVQRTFPAEAA